MRLRDGLALPPDALENLIGALDLSPGLEPNGPVTMYPELDDVLGQCDRASPAAFGRAVFERWIAARRPSDGAWALDRLSRTADDDAVRRLGTLLLDWPKSGIYEHAVQVPRVIGTDTAPMQPDRICTWEKSFGYRAAKDRMSMAADARNLTPDELADRLVPDLGLDAAGTLVLDYGPRRFTVGFDEALKPFVVDEAGKHRNTLPKPGAHDDADLASGKRRRWPWPRRATRPAAWASARVHSRTGR